MNDLYILDNPVNQTPLVDFRLSGELSITGKSFPEDPVPFFEPIINWIKDIKSACPKAMTLTVRLEYFNTSTSKIILYIFKLLENIHRQGIADIKIIWLFNKYDEEMVESGLDYQSVVDVPFELVEYE